jgi:hypothetical protein
MIANTPSSLSLSPEQIDMIQRAVAEVATSVGFGTVAIIIEKGEARRVQKTVDYFLRRPPELPPLCQVTG